MARDWSTTGSFVWSAAAAKSSYRVGVWVRSAGNSTDADEANLSVPFSITQGTQINRVSSVSISPDRTAPQPAGTSIRWTAMATGGTAPLSYKWWIYDGLTWSALGDWGPSQVTTWTPSQPNEAIKIGVWVRSATNATDVDEANISQPFPIRGGVPDCLQRLTPEVISFGSGGGSTSVHVVPGESGCAWSAFSQATWISIAGTSHGTGEGTVSFTVAPNVDHVSRTGFVMVGAKSVSITQGGISTSSGCSYAVFPTTLDVGFGNGTTSVAVTAPSGCSWAASSSGFAHVSPTAGAGSATVSVSIENNTAPEPRATVLTVAGRAVTLTQAGRSANTQGCTFEVSPKEVALEFHAASGTAIVSAPPGCAWAAASASPFLHLTGVLSGSGSGTVAYAIDANGASAPRSGLMVIAGRSVTVAQSAATLTPPCVFTLSSGEAQVSHVGGGGSVAVTTTGGCEWEAVSRTGWLHVTESTSGGETGVAWFSVDANSGSERAGTLVVAGQTFTITQSGPPFNVSASDISWVIQPDPDRVDNCFGNCGAGCGTFFNPCGGPHYWEHSVVSAPQYVGDDWEPVCNGGSSWFVVRPRYTAVARWTYHGLKSSKCEEHDGTCRNLSGISFPD